MPAGTRAAIVGGSGYVGGETLRLLLAHARVEVTQVTSSQYAGHPVTTVHPNLRGLSKLVFARHEELEPCDVVFAALPHGETAKRFDVLAAAAPMIVDLSADFRMRDAEAYRSQHGQEHPRPEVIPRFTTALPELYREQLRSSSWLSVPGCSATAAILALAPVARASLTNGEVLVDARMGSSGSGSAPTKASHHPERSRALRIYEPFGHRHAGEVTQACGVRARMTATAVDPVRGVQVVIHLRSRRRVTERDLWRIYRDAYLDEPFVRLVAQSRGVHRLPDPKLLSGSNFCDIGFAVESDGSRVVLVAALDNLVKGAAGNAVQAFNVARGFDEREGLAFAGLHPS